MHLKVVQIKNFKGIEHLHLQFQPGFNLIVGENGKGKTSVLEAIAVGLGGFIAGIDGISTRHFTRDEIRREYDTIGDGSCGCKYCVPVEVTTTAFFDTLDTSIHWTRGRNSIRASRSTLQPREIARIAEQLSNEENADLPLLCYLGAGRAWSQKREKSENIFRKKIYPDSWLYRYPAGSLQYKTTLKLVHKNGAGCMAERNEDR